MKTTSMRAFRLAGVILLATAMLCVMNGLALAKSLYAIGGINASPTPIRAYNINPDGTLTFQAEYGVSCYGGGAVGLAVDTASETLFVTYEVSNVIPLVDAKTMTGFGSTTAPGASNLAGIVMDEAKSSCISWIAAPAIFMSTVGMLQQKLLPWWLNRYWRVWAEAAPLALAWIRRTIISMWPILPMCCIIIGPLIGVRREPLP